MRFPVWIYRTAVSKRRYHCARPRKTRIVWLFDVHEREAEALRGSSRSRGTSKKMQTSIFARINILRRREKEMLFRSVFIEYSISDTHTRTHTYAHNKNNISIFRGEYYFTKFLFTNACFINVQMLSLREFFLPCASLLLRRCFGVLFSGRKGKKWAKRRKWDKTRRNKRAHRWKEVLALRNVNFSKERIRGRQISGTRYDRFNALGSRAIFARSRNCRFEVARGWVGINFHAASVRVSPNNSTANGTAFYI